MSHTPLPVSVDADNDAEAVLRSVASLDTQQYPHRAISVVSTEDPLDLIERVNNAIAACDADWIQLVYAGDLLHPASLLIQRHINGPDDGFGYFYSVIRVYDERIHQLL